MRFYSCKILQHIQFDKSGYCQFLREQRLSEWQIKALTVHIKRGKVLEDNCLSLGYFVDDGPLLVPTPRIVIYPESHAGKYSVNETLLEETGHYIQWATGSVLFSPDSVNYRNRLEEIDAKEFARLYQDKQFIQE